MIDPHIWSLCENSHSETADSNCAKMIGWIEIKSRTIKIRSGFSDFEGQAMVGRCFGLIDFSNQTTAFDVFPSFQGAKRPGTILSRRLGIPAGMGVAVGLARRGAVELSEVSLGAT